MIIDLNRLADVDGQKVQIVADSQAARVVLFRLVEGGKIAPHRSDSRVHLYCVEGEGTFQVGENHYPVKPGCMAVCEPGVLHGMQAAERMSILAFITPSPTS